MNVIVEDITSTKKRVKFEIPHDVVEERIRLSLENIRKRVKMSGFRQGKVPIKLIEKHYGKDAEKEVFEDLVTEYFEDAIREKSLKVVSMPVFEEKVEFRRNENIKVSLIVEVMPEIKDLSYEDIVIEKKEITVDDKEVDEVLSSLRERMASFIPIDEPLVMGDIVIMDYEIKDHEVRAENQVLKIGSEHYPPEFSRNLEGKKKGDTVEFEITFPDDYKNEKLRGKLSNVRVHIKETKRKIIPELNNEFAKILNLENLDALKERVKGNLILHKERNERIRQREEILNKLVDKFHFELPDVLVEEYMEAQLSEYRSKNLEDKRDDEELKKELMSSVIRRVKGELLLEMIGEKENVRINEEDIKNYIMEISERLLLNPEFVVKYYMSSAQKEKILKKGAYQTKVLDTILDKVLEKKAS